MTAKPPPARRRFGQHFLRDPVAVEQIIAALDPRPGEHLVEIGPGRGVLTEPVLAQAKRLTAVEIDRDLAAALARQYGPETGLTLLTQDALSLDLYRIGQSLRVFGNLPYNISTPLLFHLIDQRDTISDMLFMLQREVVERITATPGGKTYGRLSVMVQSCCAADPLLLVPPEAFEPMPKVDSQVIALRPKPTAADLNTAALARVVRTAFSARRKRLAKALRPLLTVTDIAQTGVDGDLRPDQLSVDEFIRLAERLGDIDQR